MEVPQMLLRDWFAGQVLSAIAGAENMHFAFMQIAEEVGEDTDTITARFAYALADEMIKVREEKK